MLSRRINQPAIHMADVSLGLGWALFLDENGKAWTMGNDNNYGQLGTSDNGQFGIIQEVVGGLIFSDAQCAKNSNLALTNDGFLWTWGYVNGLIG